MRRGRTQLILLALALPTRLFAAVLLFRIHPLSRFLDQDCEPVAIAKSLLAGHGYGSPFFSPSGPTAFVSPGYPIFLFIIFKLFGPGLAGGIAVFAINLIVSLATAYILMRLTEYLFDGKTANVAGLIYAFFFPFAMVPILLWDTAFSALFLLLAWVFLLQSRKNWLVGGFACALAGLLNPALLPTLFAFSVYGAWCERRVPWDGFLVFVLVFSAWPIRNAIVLHHFIPLRDNFAYEFWMGNHAGGNGDFVPALNPQANLSERTHFVAVGELMFMHEKSAVALHFIRSNKAAFVRLTSARIWRFWSGFAESASPASLLLVAAALVGITMRRRAFMPVALAMLLFPLPYYLTHADARFRYVVDPLLAVPAALALTAFLRRSWDEPVLNPSGF